MKGIFVFLAVALVAANATPAHQGNERGIITDAINLVKCVTAGVEQVQNSIDGVVNSVTGFEQLAQNSVNKINECFAVENPSIIEQIAIVQCVTEAANQINNDINEAINTIVANVNGVISGIGAVEACF